MNIIEIIMLSCILGGNTNLYFCDDEFRQVTGRGDSMTGIYSSGTSLYLEPVNYSEIRKGDVIFNTEANTIHRVFHLTEDYIISKGTTKSAETEYIYPGDAIERTCILR